MILNMMNDTMISDEMDRFIHRVRNNCDISDAQSAGLYSICGLALRLRDLYKWEHQLAPWVEKDSSQILDWIGDKEQLWETVGQQDFAQLPVFDEIFDPFSTWQINSRLIPEGLFYGAGYAHAMKPTFFLARIQETRILDGYSIHILGQELARDLLTLPALHQDNAIIFRADAAKLFLWDQMTYLKTSGRPALNFAFHHCGLPDNRPESMKIHFNTILSVHMDICIYHELGELTDTVFDHEIWKEMVAAFAHTPVELLARAIKDLLADTTVQGTLIHLIETRNTAGLGLYAAFIDGMMRAVFPELRQAFGELMTHGKWEPMLRAVQAGFQTASRYAEQMVELFSKGKQKQNLQWAQEQITQRLITPHT